MAEATTELVAQDKVHSARTFCVNGQRLGATSCAVLEGSPSHQVSPCNGFVKGLPPFLSPALPTTKFSRRLQLIRVYGTLHRVWSVSNSGSNCCRRRARARAPVPVPASCSRLYD